MAMDVSHQAAGIPYDPRIDDAFMHRYATEIRAILEPALAIVLDEQHPLDEREQRLAQHLEETARPFFVSVGLLEAQP